MSVETPVLLSDPWLKFCRLVEMFTPDPTWSEEPVDVAFSSVWLKLSSLRVLEDLNPVVLALAMLSPIVSMFLVNALRAETPLVSEPMSAIMVFLWLEF
jgi:hypothetical protein